jgi:hypothetical protein
VHDKKGDATSEQAWTIVINGAKRGCRCCTALFQSPPMKRNETTQKDSNVEKKKHEKKNTYIDRLMGEGMFPTTTCLIDLK